VTVLLANQALYRGSNRQVIQYAETALRGARGSLSPALVTDLNALQAKAYARIGDREGCHASMARAEDMSARIRPGEEPLEPSPGLSDSAHSIYLADGAERIGSPEDDFESDSVSWVPLASVPSLISSGDITSGTTLAALLFVIATGQPRA
jgi:hypothetical protein